jgi:hypothetical protein
MTIRAERKRQKREAIEREQRIARKSAALEEALSLVHRHGTSFDADDRTNAVLIDADGRVLARKVDPPQPWESPGRSVDPRLPSGHPRSGEVASMSSRALVRDALDPRISGVLPEAIRDVARDRLLDGS